MTNLIALRKSVGSVLPILLLLGCGPREKAGNSGDSQPVQLVDFKGQFIDLNPRLKNLDGYIFCYPPEAELFERLEVFIPQRKEVLDLRFQLGSGTYESVEEIDEHIEMLIDNAKRVSKTAHHPLNSNRYLIYYPNSAVNGNISIFGHMIVKNGVIVGASLEAQGNGFLDFVSAGKFPLGGLIEFGTYLESRSHE